MKKILILIPIFNDWESLKKLIEEINENIKHYNDFYFECLIVNDASTIEQPKITKPSHFKSLEILTMKKIGVTRDVLHLGLDIYLIIKYLIISY